MTPLDDVISLDATAQAELVRRGEVKTIELMNATIARIERLNPMLNAVITPILQRKRLRLADFANQAHLAERLMAFVAEWNEHAHPFQWSTKSLANVMSHLAIMLAKAA